MQNTANIAFKNGGNSLRRRFRPPPPHNNQHEQHYLSYPYDKK
jgi:hypothetical protein